MLAITVCRVGVGVDVGVPARAGEREKAKAATQRNREETICFIGIDLGKGLINGDKLLLQQFFPFISRYEAHEERQGFPSPFVPSCENKTAWTLLKLSAYCCKVVLAGVRKLYWSRADQSPFCSHCFHQMQVK